MKDNESTFNFAPLEDDEELDLDAIFGAAASEPTPPPPIPMQAEAKQEAAPDNTAPAKTQDAPVAAEPLELFPAFTAQEAPAKEPVKDLAPRPQTQPSLFDKPPVFQYGSAREPITDTELTFDVKRRRIFRNWRSAAPFPGRCAMAISPKPSPRPKPLRFFL